MSVTFNPDGGMDIRFGDLLTEGELSPTSPGRQTSPASVMQPQLQEGPLAKLQAAAVATSRRPPDHTPRARGDWVRRTNERRDLYTSDDGYRVAKKTPPEDRAVDEAAMVLGVCRSDFPLEARAQYLHAWNVLQFVYLRTPSPEAKARYQQWGNRLGRLFSSSENRQAKLAAYKSEHDPAAYSAAIANFGQLINALTEQGVQEEREAGGRPAKDLLFSLSETLRWHEASGILGRGASSFLTLAVPTINQGVVGMGKLLGNRGELRNVMRMLGRNDDGVFDKARIDIPGLKNAAMGSGPLRTYATGVKCGRQLLERNGYAAAVQALPQDVRAALTDLRNFEKANPDLTALGDEHTFDGIDLTQERVDQIASQFEQARSLMIALERAMMKHGLA